MTAPNQPAEPAGPDPGTTPQFTPPPIGQPAEPAGGPPPAPQQARPQGQPQSTDPNAVPGQEPDQRPPWERNGEQFDPDKAWKRIQALEADRDQARSKRDEHKAKLDEIDRAGMSEAQQAAADRDSYKTRAEAAEWELARHEVLAEKGLNPTAVQFLTGSNRDELTASADALLTTFGDAVRLAAASPSAPGQAPAAAPTQRPTEALRVPPGGSDPSSQFSADDLDPAKLAAQIPRGL